jgi:uncharacterized repeat protein (TIGR03847 family)
VPILEVDFNPVDSITAGVEGVPGSRTSFIEGRQGPRACTLLVEKIQLQELGGQLLQLLDPTNRRVSAAPEPTTRPGDPPSWRVGNIQLAVDEEAGQCTLLLEELRLLEEDEDESEPDETPESGDEPELRVARLVASLQQVRALAERALRVIEGGRTICPLCHLPIDPHGHVCPASNGHHRI